MNDEEILYAARQAYYKFHFEAGRNWSDVIEEAIANVYRAGMEAGRAEAAAKPKRRKEPNGDAVGVDEIVQAGADRQHAEDWMRVRKQHKAPLTRTSWEAMGREAAKAGLTVGQAVQMCAERGWRGFRAEYAAKDAPSGPCRGPRSGRMDRQLETAALMTGAARKAPTDMGEIYDVGQQRITSR